MTQRLTVDGPLSLESLYQVWCEPVRLRLSAAARGRLERSRGALEALIGSGRRVYGVNTGFGRLAQTRIAAKDLDRLQHNLLRSHATGVGAPLEPAVVRLVLLLQIVSLARGHSGVRPLLVERLVEMFNAGILPLVPSKGSVGASGDLAPLAHLSLPLLGEGRVLAGGAARPAAVALAEAGIEPLALSAKEGLALLNGTQVSTAMALAGLFEARRNLAGAIVGGALAVEAALGSHVPFDARIHALRGHPGQVRVAALFRDLLTDSEINRSHATCDRVQDPYCLRCQPQVLGACLDQLSAAAATLAIEANAVTDNPLVFPEQGEILSGGNFHAEPVAMACDGMALAIAETGALAERQVAMLIDAGISQLPPFLVREAGLDSGFMVAHVTAAALASENKSLAHPASVDSLPTSANQEDHVSMATFAARRLTEMNANTRGILAILWLSAAQGIDLRRPLRTAPILESAVAALRERVAFLDGDRELGPDIDAAAALLAEGALQSLLPGPLPLGPA